MTSSRTTPAPSPNLDIHRLLDEAFAGIEVTPEVQDLKEEMRGNLVARVIDLQASGVSPADAAHRAIAEVGDVRDIVDETRHAAGPAQPWHRNRVRPRPGYVLRTVLVALLGLASLAVLALLTTGVWTGARPTLDLAAAVAVAALAGAVIVGDALRQETTTNYPVSRGRAFGYAAATALAIGGLGSAGGYLPSHDLPWLVVAVALLLTAIVTGTYVGATQTNRHKPWVVREHARYAQVGDRFEQDPAAAARFGIYTATIWIVAGVAFVVLGIAVGWVWSWLALVAGLVTMMLTLARMLFGQRAAS